MTALQIQRLQDKVRQFQFFPARLSFRGERALAEMTDLQATEDAFYHRCRDEAVMPKPFKKRRVATEKTKASARRVEQQTDEQRAATAAKEKQRVEDAKDKAKEEKQAHDFLTYRASFASDILSREREWLVLFWPPPFLS